MEAFGSSESEKLESGIVSRCLLILSFICAAIRVYSYLQTSDGITNSAAVSLSSIEFSLASTLLRFLFLFLERFSSAAYLSSAISVGRIQVLGMKS